MSNHIAESSTMMSVQDTSKVSIFPISQATAATFTDLYFRLTFFFFIQKGSKRLLASNQGEMVGNEGDLIVFPPGSLVTIENRPVPDDDYRALGMCFTHDLIEAVYAGAPKMKVELGVRIVRSEDNHVADILALIRATLEDDSLPAAIRDHRLLEPLIWLREQGIHLPVQVQNQPMSRVRRLIETDLSHPWRADEVAKHLSMSEATMRRWLSKTGHGFAKILLYTRLEHGLSLLQMTDTPVSQIALDCGFKTSSHFSSVFRKRFGIKPNSIRLATI